MVKQGKGSIINFSSMAAFRPITRVCGYAAAKAGISNFTAFMATECAKKFGEGIRVNAIAPGFIESDMTDAIPEKMKDAMNCSSTNETYWSGKRSGRSCGFLSRARVSYRSNNRY